MKIDILNNLKKVLGIKRKVIILERVSVRYFQSSYIMYKVENIILSCTTIEQLETSWKLITNLNTRNGYYNVAIQYLTKVYKEKFLSFLTYIEI